MNFGILEGLVRGTQSLAFYHEVTGSAVSSIPTGNILNGNEDGWYTIIVRHVSNASASYSKLQINGDTGNNYGIRGISARDTTVADVPYTSQASILLGIGDTDSGETCFSVSRLYARSGSVRLLDTCLCDGITGTTVFKQITAGQVWNNTVDNILNMTLSAGSGTLAVGTMLIILKDNNFTNGTPTGNITTPYIKGCWRRLSGSGVLTSATNLKTFSSLDGNSAVLYYLSASIKGVGANTFLGVRPNGLTSGYGFQRLAASNTTVSASRGSADTAMQVAYCDGGEYSQAGLLMFAKSGFIRPALSFGSFKVSTTPAVNEIRLHGLSLNNTADNITSLDVVSVDKNFDIGSQFDLYGLYPTA